MVILIAYNVFLFLINRSKDILLSAVCLSSILCYQLLTDKLLWSIYSETLRLPILAVSLAIFFFCQFSRDFLHLSTYLPKANRLLHYTGHSTLILFFLGFLFPLSVMSIISLTIGLVVFFALVIFGIHTLVKKSYQPARFFLIACTFLTASCASILANTFFSPIDITLVQYGDHIGGLLGALFLTFALSDRINRITQDREKVENEAKRDLEKANRSLTDNAATLRETMEELKMRNRLKDDFLLSMNHELRTPINGIQGSLNLLKETQIETQQMEYIRIAENSTGNLLSLINSVIELNSLTQNLITIKQDKVNLYELLNNCIKSIHKPCEAKGISVDMINLSLPEFVFSDSERLEHVIMNLLNNAVKFTDKGAISLSSLIHKHDDDVYEFELLIKDTGIGIDPKELNNVFDSFIQADTGYTRKHGGMGLGLSICKLIIEKMEGKIFTASVPGVGSTFIIRLPLKTPANVTIKSFNKVMDKPLRSLPSITPQSHPTPDAIHATTEIKEGPINVLIVEDLPVNQLLLKKALESLGMLPSTASNGQEALDKVKQQSFHIILMDCQMPVMDGFEATRQIRHLEAEGNLSSQHIPIIAVTANVLERDKKDCIAAGMDSYIAKPYQISRLEQIILSHIKFTEEKEANETSP
ncbi:MAG: response regulator [Pseudomonadales bacterium]|nr:response regulator [Pseudomonadales bacterium]